jgi:hypothetical protein
MALRYISRFVAAILFAISAVVSSAQPILAFNGEADYNFFETIPTYLYDPTDTATCSDPDSEEILNDANRNYKGGLIINATQLDTIKDYQATYEVAADIHNVPWQLIAAIHLYETGLKQQGPSDGTGPYHDVSGATYPTGVLSTDDFANATDKVASILHGLAGSKDLDKAAGVDNVKSVVFAYTTNNNSLSATKQAYIGQAKALEFSDAEAARGEGSPDVMNGADQKRDPRSSKAVSTWGWVPPGKTALSYPAPNGYGIVVLYAALAGINISTNSCLSGDLIPGGMNGEQAKAFIKQYLSHVNDGQTQINNLLDRTHAWWWGNTCNPPRSPGLVDLGIPNLTTVGDTTTHAAKVLADCTALSAYFISQYTSLVPGSTNGGTWVNSLKSRNPGKTIPTGTVPKAYSVFSTYRSDPRGHTGVILGVDTDRNVVTVAQMGCNLSLQWGYDNTREFPLSSFMSGYTYAYLDDYLKLEKREAPSNAV